MTKREEIIARQKEIIAQKEKEKAEKEKGSYTPDYEEIKWAGIVDKGSTVVRFLGNPTEQRTESSDPKIVNISWVIDESGKYHRFILPSKEEKDYILWKVINTVLSYKWDKELNAGKGGKVYTYADTHPELVKRILTNNKHNPSAYETGMTPQRTLIWNVVDYMDDWCKTNKHSKLLSKKIGKTKEGKEMPAEGVPASLSDIIFSDLVEIYGFWDEFQTCIRKDSESDNSKYKVFHLVEQFKNIKDSTVEKYTKNDFTDEKDYVLYDIDKLFKVSSYFKIKKVLGLFIQQVDKALNTNFYEELEKLVEIEKAEWEKNKESSEEETGAPALTKKEEVKTESAPASRTATREPVKAKEDKPFKLDDLVDIFPAIAEMSEEDKALAIGFDSENVQVIWKEGLDMYECVNPECGATTPSISTCICGQKYTG